MLLGVQTLLLLSLDKGVLRLDIALGGGNQLFVHQLLRLPGLAQISRLIGLLVDIEHCLAFLLHPGQAAAIDFALRIGLHLLLQTTGLLHQPTRFLRELSNQMLFRGEHAGQRSLHALQRQRLPAQRKIDALVRGLNSGADPLLHILQIAEQAACHQHIAQQQPQEQGPHLASHRKVLEFLQQHEHTADQARSAVLR